MKTLKIAAFFGVLYLTATFFDERLAYLLALSAVVIWFLQGDGKAIWKQALGNFRLLLGV